MHETRLLTVCRIPENTVKATYTSRTEGLRTIPSEGICIGIKVQVFFTEVIISPNRHCAEVLLH